MVVWESRFPITPFFANLSNSAIDRSQHAANPANNPHFVHGSICSLIHPIVPTRKLAGRWCWRTEKRKIKFDPVLRTFYYRLLDARTGRHSTALATNIDFSTWATYLGDPPLAAAFLDRLVDGAVILKLSGRSYRAHRARNASESGQSESK